MNLKSFTHKLSIESIEPYVDLKFKAKNVLCVFSACGARVRRNAC